VPALGAVKKPPPNDVEEVEEEGVFWSPKVAFSIMKKVKSGEKLFLFSFPRSPN
jgi:hypothetical protein